MVARRVRVNGRVQGVWFRAWTRDQARALGVVGWVRNCDDGSVEAQVEGQTDAVDQLIRRMRRGPSGAQVDEVTAVDTVQEGNEGFDVRH